MATNRCTVPGTSHVAHSVVSEARELKSIASIVHLKQKESEGKSEGIQTQETPRHASVIGDGAKARSRMIGAKWRAELTVTPINQA